VFKQIQSIRHDKFDCSFLDMVFQHECRRGYTSVFTFKCKMCNFESTMYSERSVQSNYLGINKAIVNGSLAIGNTYNILFKFNLYIIIYNITLSLTKTLYHFKLYRNWPCSIKRTLGCNRVTKYFIYVLYQTSFDAW